MGEVIAVRWLSEQGFEIIEQNYRKKWGEIDIVARETSGNVRFIEVKSVSYETKIALLMAASRGTWRPEEKVHHKKQARFGRAIETWLLENEAPKWQIDILALRLVPREKYCTVNHLENVIFEY